jgi:hypothetical protein
VAAFGGPSASRIAPMALVYVRAPPPCGESTREPPIRRHDGGGGNGEMWLGLGANRMGKASIYRATIYS